MIEFIIKVVKTVGILMDMVVKPMIVLLIVQGILLMGNLIQLTDCIRLGH